jgi:hypothetical protein
MTNHALTLRELSIILNTKVIILGRMITTYTLGKATKNRGAIYLVLRHSFPFHPGLVASYFHLRCIKWR